MVDLGALLSHIARHMVSEPEAVQVRLAEKDGGLGLTLAVAAGDVGRVIGRGGYVAKDLRTIVRAAAPFGQRVTVDIEDA